MSRTRTTATSGLAEKILYELPFHRAHIEQLRLFVRDRRPGSLEARGILAAAEAELARLERLVAGVRS